MSPGARSFLSPLLKSTEGARLRNQRTGADLAISIERAFDGPSRRTGLLGRTSLPAGSALVIAPCFAVHTIGMRFPIDIVFVRRDGRVARVWKSVGPYRVAAAWGAHAAIELPAGTITRVDTQPSDTLVVVRG